MVQTDLSATLATNNDQTLFAPAQEAIGFIKEQNAKAGSIGAGKISPTMKCDHPPAVAYKVEEQEDVENGSAVH